jgi:hypothetical protein
LAIKRQSGIVKCRLVVHKGARNFIFCEISSLAVLLGICSHKEAVSLDQVRRTREAKTSEGDLMKSVVMAVMGMALLSGVSLGQATFEVTGTPVPPDLLRQNYGSLPKGIGAFDLNICNVSEKRESLVSSRVFQSLASTNPQVQPIGRQIMLAVILRSQGRSAKNILNVTLTSVTGVFSVISASKYKLSGNWAAGVAIASLASQQILNIIKPSTSTNSLEKFESQVLEPTLMLDADSCIERTVFTVATQEQMRATRFSFHVQ